jgi:hypothetical protein
VPGVPEELLRDEEYREEQAKAAYYRERVEDAALDQEHDVSGEHEYQCIAWESLDGWAQRPYRTAVAQVCDSLASLVEAT